MATERSNELTSFMNMLDAELMCGICLELFRVPTILPCGHVFCRECLHSVVDSGQSFSFLSIGPPTSFNCPVCQRDFNISKYGIDTLPVNKPLESIISMYQNFSPVDIFDLAWNRDLKIDISTCPDHSEPMSRYCESCSTSVCRKCEKEEHRSRHRVKQLTEVAAVLQAEIADTLTELKKRTIPIYTHIAQLENMLKRIETEEENLKKYLSHCVESLKSTMRAKQDELSDALHSTLHEATIPISEQLRKCKQSRTNIQDMMRKLSSVRKCRDINQRIKLMKDSILQLNVMLQNDYDWLADTSLLDPQIPDMKLDTQDIAEHIGSLNWIDQEKKRRIMCSKCTQTESSDPKASPGVKDNLTEGAEGSNTVSAESVDNHEGSSDTAKQTDVPVDKQNSQSTPNDTKTTQVKMKQRNDNVKDTENQTDMKEVQQLNDEHQDKENVETLVLLGKADRSLDGQASDRTATVSGATNRTSELVTDDEIDAITNGVPEQHPSVKHVKSTGRRSFPFDRSSSKNSGKPNEEHIFLPNSRTHSPSGRAVNGDIKTSPRDSSTSAALATFVARRRTLSPFNAANTNRRVSTSPLAASNSPTKPSNSPNKPIINPDKPQTNGDLPKHVKTVPNDPERALSPRNYSKEPITVKLDFETDV